MTKEQIDTLLERLNGLGLWADDRTTGYKQESTRSEATLMSASWTFRLLIHTEPFLVL